MKKCIIRVLVAILIIPVIIVCVFYKWGFSWSTNLNDIGNGLLSATKYEIIDDFDVYDQNGYRINPVWRCLTKVGNPLISIQNKSKDVPNEIEWHVERGFSDKYTKDSTILKDFQGFFKYECTVHIENADIKFDYYTSDIFSAVNEIESCIISVLSSDICCSVAESAQ